MILHIIGLWLSSALTKTIGWTLIHSLWMGFIAMMIAIVIMKFTRTTKAAIRYNLLITTLSAFIIAVAFTFITQINSQDGPVVTTNASPATCLSSQPIANHSPATPAGTNATIDISGLEDVVNRNISLIVGLWLIVCCFQLFRLSSGLRYVYEIKDNTYRNADPYWLQKCEELKNKLNIRVPVGLKESARISVPVVAGMFKPLILVPIGILTQLPANQIESILLHELAHVKRNDYLVNFLQNVIQTFFFFNPAILWLSYVIKEEREACCDELALQHLESRSTYIQALVSFQEYVSKSPEYALAFPGRKNSLLHRVIRIVDNENRKVNSFEKAFLCMGLIAAFSFAVIPGMSKSREEVALLQQNKIGKGTNQENAPFSNTLQDSIVCAPLENTVNDTIPRIVFREREKTNVQRNDTSTTARKQDDQQSAKLDMLTDQLNFLDTKQSLLQLQQENQSDELKKIAFADSIKQEKIFRSLKAREKPRTAKSSLHGLSSANAQADAILDILITHKIITEKKGTNFRLTDTELYVNSVKYPGEVHEELKKKFFFSDGDAFYYSSNGNTTSITVNRAD